MSELVFRNRQRTRALNLPLLRRITLHVVEAELNVADYELGFHFVSAGEMARVNEEFLQHSGSTDVITFDYGEELNEDTLHGEVYISVADAVEQAAEFHTTWQSEVIRYVIHGLLHLCGYDDLRPAKRRVMKRQEDRLVRRISTQFPLAQLARTSRRTPKTRNPA